MDKIYKEQTLIVSFLIVYFINAYWFKFLGWENIPIFKAIKDILIVFSLYILSLQVLYANGLFFPKIYCYYLLYFVVYIYIDILLGRFSIINTLVGIRNYVFPLLFSLLLSFVNQKLLDKLVNKFFYMVFFMSILGIFLFFFTDSYLVRLGGCDRNVSFIGNPNSLAIIDVWALWYFYLQKDIRFRKIIIFVLTISFVLTKSVEGGVALILTICYYLYIKNGLNIKTVFFSLIVVSILMLFLPRLYYGLIKFEDPSVLARVQIISKVLENLSFNSFIIGHGVGTAANLFNKSHGIIGITDNSYLAVLYQFGIVGLMCYCMLLYRIFRSIKIFYIKLMAISFFVSSFTGNFFELGFPLNYLFFCFFFINYRKMREFYAFQK